MPRRINVILPDNWPEIRDSVIKPGETEQELIRSAIQEKIRRRGSKETLAVRPVGKPRKPAAT